MSGRLRSGTGRSQEKPTCEDDATAISALVEQTKNTVRHILFVCVVLFVCEHLGRRFDFQYIRISVGLTHIYAVLSPIVRWIGRLVADAAAYLSMIDLAEFFQTLTDITTSVVNVVCLPVEFLQAFVSRVVSTNHVVEVAVGIVVESTILWHTVTSDGALKYPGRFLLAHLVVIGMASWSIWDAPSTPPTSPPFSPYTK